MTTSNIITLKWQAYRLVRKLARGGLGEVFEARKTFPLRQERACAIKFLREDKLHDAEAITALADEGLIGWDICHHPNLIAFYDFAIWPDGRPFIVTEFVDGPDLSQAMSFLHGDFPIIQRIAYDMLGALDHLHRHEVVHCDVAPQNILIAPSSRVKLADLGLATHVSEGCEGSVCGVPAYVAPERHRGGKPSFAADLYGLGAVLYELIAGRPPHGSGTFEQLATEIHGKIPELCPTTPDNLRALTMALLDCVGNRPSIAEAYAILERGDAPIAHDAVVTNFVCAWQEHCEDDLGELHETVNLAPISVAVKEFLADTTEQQAEPRFDETSPRRSIWPIAAMLMMCLLCLGLALSSDRMVVVTPSVAPSPASAECSEPLTEAQIRSASDEPASLALAVEEVSERSAYAELIEPDESRQPGPRERDPDGLRVRRQKTKDSNRLANLERLLGRMDTKTENKLVARFSDQEPIAINRAVESDDGIMLSVRDGRLSSRDLLLNVNLRNHGTASFRGSLVRVTGTDRTVNHARTITYRRSPECLANGVIPSARSCDATIWISDVDQLINQSITIEIGEPGGTRSVKLSDIAWW